MVPSQKSGGRVSEQKSGLPDADPGTLTAFRWRKRFCFKGETGTIVDNDKMALALALAVLPLSSRKRARPGVMHSLKHLFFLALLPMNTLGKDGEGADDK